jgi:23S rRNA pseudouridine2457 synthase
MNLRLRNSAGAPSGKLRYFILNKPYGVLSQFTPDHPGQRTLAEFHLPEGIYAAGRLDQDSEGLLLLTNDGALIKELLDPAKGHPRTYLVQVEGIPTEEALTNLRSGVKIGDYQTKAAKVSTTEEPPDLPPRDPPIRVRKQIPTSWITLTLTEGKNRQVRRMTAAVGNPTLRLIRVQMGAIRIEGLGPGEFRELTSQERGSLRG